MPKTAGTTLVGILKRQYLRRPFDLDDFDPDLNQKRFALQDPETVSWFSGHAPLISGIEMADTATTITVLREPISRVKSFCQHVSEGKSPHLVADFPPATFSLDAFLESGDVELSNIQTRILVNRLTNRGPRTMFDAMTSAEAEHRALDNLFGRVDHFGIQESFDETLILFKSALNWRLPIYASRNMARPTRRLTFEPRHLERIAELNAIDSAVYSRARERFLAIDIDQAALARFRRVNRMLGPCLSIVDTLRGTTGRA